MEGKQHNQTTTNMKNCIKFIRHHEICKNLGRFVVTLTGSPGEYHHGQKPPHYPNGTYCTKIIHSCPRIHQVTKPLRLISFKISHIAKAKPLRRALVTFLVYAKDRDSSDDEQILNSFDTHPQSPGLNHNKQSIRNVRIRPIQEYLFLTASAKFLARSRHGVCEFLYRGEITARFPTSRRDWRHLAEIVEISLQLHAALNVSF